MSTSPQTHAAAGASIGVGDGADVTAPVLGDGSAVYTPGVSQRRSGSTTYDLHDQLGSATKQTGSTATVTATRTYDAFGMLVSSTGTPQGPFGFAATSGYQEDEDSGLKLLGHRYYDASTGRFLTRDPAQDGRNWYAYCENNPTWRVDAIGLWWQIALGVAAVGATLYGLYELGKWASGWINKGKKVGQQRVDDMVNSTQNEGNQAPTSGGGDHSGGGNEPAPPSLGGPIREPIKQLQKEVADKARDQYVYAPIEGVHDGGGVIHWIVDHVIDPVIHWRLW